MVQPGEPKNGDFASYVESLGRNGAQAPGQVLKPTRAEKSGRRAAAKPQPASPRSMPGGSTAGSPEAAVPLARQAGQRRVGFILGLAAAALGWYTIRQVLNAFEQGTLDADTLFPAVFTGFVALMLLKARSNVRAKAQGTLPQYGKLQTSARKDNGA